MDWYQPNLFGYKGVVQIENVVTNLKIIMKLKLAS